MSNWGVIERKRVEYVGKRSTYRVKMAFIPQCDNCGEVFMEGGFKNSLKKVVSRGRKIDAKDFTVDITIRPPHLCGKCFDKIMKEALKK